MRLNQCVNCSLCTFNWSRHYWRERNTCYMCRQQQQAVNCCCSYLWLSLEDSVERQQSPAYADRLAYHLPLRETHSLISLFHCFIHIQKFLWNRFLPTWCRSLFQGFSRGEANLCWPSTSLVLLAPFVWLMSECVALPIVPLSEPHTPSTLPLSNSHEVMS